jgi:hypothetical protein
MTRDKEYFAAASRKSRAKKQKKLAAMASPRLKKALAMVVLAETRGITLTAAAMLLDEFDAKKALLLGCSR